MNYHWDLSATHPTQQAIDMHRRFHLPLIITELLCKHGIVSKSAITSFLKITQSQLDDPFKLHDMKTAVDIIHYEIKHHGKIIVYSDYDMDGIGSNTIMYSVLKQLGANVVGYCPDRGYDGYGLNMKESHWIAKHNFNLVITTDNGISCYDEVSYLRKHHIKVIITDHHGFPTKKVKTRKNGKAVNTIKYVLPPANAIVMTLFPHHHYPNETDFCGAGIAFKVAQALLHRVPTGYFDIACLATIADSVHLTKENRVIVHFGLLSMRDEPRLGLRALAQVADIKLNKMTSNELSFSLIPRFNALGRMGKLGCNANIGRELLLTGNPDKAMKLAKITEKMNRQRQKIMHKDTDIAMKYAKRPSNKNATVLVIANHSFNPGIVGIVASQLQNHFYKPIIVIGHLAGDPKNQDRGSGRSIPEFNMFKAMNPLRKDMISFGGHSMACGLSINVNQISQLRHDLLKISKPLGHIVPTVRPDCLIKPSQVTFKLYHEIIQLQPFGVGNEQPLFAIRLNKVHNLSQMGKTNRHLSFTLGYGRHSVKCVAWRMGSLYNSLAQNPYDVEIVGYLQINRWHGYTNLQVNVQHIHHYYTKSATRYNLGQMYTLLLHYSHKGTKMLNLKKIEVSIAKYMNLPLYMIQHSLVIFNELHFITITKSQIHVAKKPIAHKLTDAPSYEEYFPE